MVASACQQKATTNEHDPKKLKIDRVFVSTNLSTCARTDDERFYCWGDNRFGQLGILNDGWTQKPLVMDTTDIIFDKLAMGDDHTCGISGGDLYCWGSNENSRLGLGRTSSVVDPELVELGSVKDVAVNSRHSCAITSDDELYCWGLNDRGSLGLGLADGKQESSPKKVELSGVKKVALGPDFTCAVANGDELYCWGNSDDGRLGVGESLVDQTKPAKVDIPSVKALSLGDSYGCAVTKANELYCWGSNKKGQLGIAERATVVAPTKLEKVTNIVEVAAGQEATPPHVCALDEGGRVYCAGAGDAIGTGGGGSKTFVKLGSVKGVTEIAAGRARTCAVTEGWGLYCWGATTINDEIAPKPEQLMGPP